MRYQVFQIVQFLFSLALIAGAFVSGLLVGWYFWGPRKSVAAVAEKDWVANGHEGRGHLFSPDGQVAAAALFEEPSADLAKTNSVDLRFGVIPRVELPAGHVLGNDDSEDHDSEDQNSLIGDAL